MISMKFVFFLFISFFINFIICSLNIFIIYIICLCRKFSFFFILIQSSINSIISFFFLKLSINFALLLFWQFFFCFILIPFSFSFFFLFLFLSLRIRMILSLLLQGFCYFFYRSRIWGWCRSSLFCFYRNRHEFSCFWIVSLIPVLLSFWHLCS